MISKFFRLSGYGIGDFGLNIYWNTISIWLIYWYTDIVGIRPEVAGTLFLIGMIWDGFSDPIAASISERVQSRHGTYRPFLLYGSVGLAISSYILFWVPPFDGPLLFAILVITGILFRTAYTFVAIPYAALSSRITYDSVERTEFTSTRMFFAFLGLLLVSNQFPPLARWFSNGETFTASGFQAAVAVSAVIATIAIWICFFGTKEKPLPLNTRRAHFTFDELGRALLRNRALTRLLVVVALQSSAFVCVNIMLVYFIVSHQPAFASKEVVLTAYALATIAGVPIWAVCIRALGKKPVWIGASVLFSLAGLLLLSSGPIVSVGIPLQILVYGFCGGAYAILVWSLVPDTVEFGQFSSGVRSEAAVFGSVLVVQKISGGMMGFFVGLIIAMVGYEPNQEVQSVSVARNIAVFLAICPSVLLLVSLIPVSFLPLNRAIHADIVDRLSSADNLDQKRERDS